jgi:hypothetical protein
VGSKRLLPDAKNGQTDRHFLGTASPEPENPRPAEKAFPAPVPALRAGPLPDACRPGSPASATLPRIACEMDVSSARFRFMLHAAILTVTKSAPNASPPYCSRGEPGVSVHHPSSAAKDEREKQGERVRPRPLTSAVAPVEAGRGPIRPRAWSLR